MPLLSTTLEKIKKLEYAEQKLKEQELSLENMLKRLKESVREGGPSEKEFMLYRSLSVQHMIEKTKIQHELNAARLLVTLLSERAPSFSRILIGSGVAATLVYQEIPPEFLSRNKENPLLPNVISVNDPMNPHTWPKEGTRLMGQPAKVQTPIGFSVHSSDLVLQEGEDKTNPYNYVVAEDFNHALIATQCDLNMPTVPLKIKAIETQSASSSDWEYPECKHRLVVDLPNEEDISLKYLYTEVVDLCAGLGDSTKLDETQVDPVLANQLIQKQSLVYAQDQAVPLRGEILLYGGSAVNSAWATEILSGHVSTDENTTKIIGLVSRNARSLEAISTLSRFISDACQSALDLSVGVLKNVKELPSGRLAVTFSAPAEHGRFRGLPEDYVIECDQLIVAIGQQAPEVTRGLKDFEECIYDPRVSGISSVSQAAQIPLGTHSKDGTIIVWGALGTLGIGLEAQKSRIFNKKVEAHANTYPYESQALGGIFRMSIVIPQMAKQLKAKNFFPDSLTYDSRRYLIPDINQATVEELANLIVHKESALRLKYAEAIIQLRSKVMDNKNKKAPGIQSVEQLAQVVPMEYLSYIKNMYFPFAPVVDSGHDKQKTADNTIPVMTSGAYKQSGFFTTPQQDGFDRAMDEMYKDETEDALLPGIKVPDNQTSIGVENKYVPITSLIQTN